MSGKVVLLNGSLAESLINFRGPFIIDLLALGHIVHVSAPDIDATIRHRLQQMGAVVHEVLLARTGLNPIADYAYYKAMRQLIRDICPAMVIGYTVKPNIWGSLAARAEGVRSASMVTGLGYSFIARGSGPRVIVQKAVKWLYARATVGNWRVIFQNPDDLADFVSAGCLKDVSKARLVNGSGVDLAHYPLKSLPAAPAFLLIARLLWTKGIREYCDAALILKAKCPTAIVRLAGPADNGPDGIPASQIDIWEKAGIEYLGPLSDVRPALAQCSVYVLPSYREGTPRTVLEAMATGRAIITTDVAGCRETTIDGLNGLVVAVQDTHSLAEAMAKLAMSPDKRKAMGMASRKLVEEKYAIEKVNWTLIDHLELNK